MKNEKESIDKIPYIIKIYVIVQGVGFRLFIYFSEDVKDINQFLGLRSIIYGM